MSALASLPKEHFLDSEVTLKARHMLRRRSVEQVSDYLGMDIEQVRAISETCSVSARGRPRGTSRREVYHDTAFNRPVDAEQSSQRHKRAALADASQYFRKELLRYGLKNGLPNMSRLQCLGELRSLALLREEELALADRIEAELHQPSPLSRMDEQ